MAASAKIDVADFQREFFSQVGDFSQLLNLIEALHGIHYFIKDRSCRHVAVSDTFAKRLGLASAEDMIGRTNYDFYPKLIADQLPYVDMSRADWRIRLDYHQQNAIV